MIGMCLRCHELILGEAACSTALRTPSVTNVTGSGSATAGAEGWIGVGGPDIIQRVEVASTGGLAFVPATGQRACEFLTIVLPRASVLAAHWPARA